MPEDEIFDDVVEEEQEDYTIKRLKLIDTITRHVDRILWLSASDADPIRIKRAIYFLDAALASEKDDDYQIEMNQTKTIIANEKKKHSKELKSSSHLFYAIEEKQMVRNFETIIRLMQRKNLVDKRGKTFESK